MYIKTWNYFKGCGLNERSNVPNSKKVCDKLNGIDTNDDLTDSMVWRTENKNKK